MKIVKGPPQQGIALIIVMVTIFVLAMLAGGFAYSMKVETKLARNAQNEAELEWLGRSGVELARYILAQQMAIPSEPYDSLNQKWAGGPGGFGDTNSILADISLENNELGNGRFSLKIVDQERKFNINAADEMLLRQALILIGVDAADSSTIIDSILDWRDPDDDTHLSGWESNDYLALARPYAAKNGPIDDLSELLLIHGVTPEMYWGAGSTNYPPTVYQPRLPGGLAPGAPPSYPIGFADLFNTVSDGRLNINTASATALQMIPGIDENTAQGIITTRAGPDGVDGTEDDIPFRSPGELINVPGLNRQIVGQLARYFNVRSSTFEVQVDAEIDQYKRQYIALLRRNNPRDVQVLYMYCK
ncbi:MAG: general secretion pathway protein GspK [Verrucomicrobia bacterium]|nr:general secretion pathway protein GspK [Verrucomicrobiota bacterium]